MDSGSCQYFILYIFTYVSKALNFVLELSSNKAMRTQISPVDSSIYYSLISLTQSRCNPNSVY